MGKMNEQKSPNQPYETLGTQLRLMREQSHESIAEVSGAVEIDEHILATIEAGKTRPAEDILMLLISHFDIEDHEALRLWESAGYASEYPEHVQATIDPGQAKAMIMLLAVEMRTMYTDNLDVTCTNAGVTLSFNQMNPQSKPVGVARLGMSYEQAEQVVITLQKALLKAKYLKGPQALPPNTQKL